MRSSCHDRGDQHAAQKFHAEPAAARFDEREARPRWRTVDQRRRRLAQHLVLTAQVR
jgi:hypothetical protein